MKKILINGLFFTLLSTSTAHSQVPLWQFTPLTTTSAIVSANSTAIIKYRVSNNSPHPHHLIILPMPGVSQVRPCILAPKENRGDSCILTLMITGNTLPIGGILAGPALCQTDEDGTPNKKQCYQPSSEKRLHITQEGNTKQFAIK